MPRVILHCDLDAFYASVEQRDRPELRGRPVIVGGSVRRGVVCAASYEARPFGVRSAIPMARAVRLCPEAVVLAPRMSHYAAVSRQFFGILGRYSPLVEGLSLDEAFLDVTGAERLLGEGPAIARGIKQAVRDELALVVSVGVAPTKFLAKIASDLSKPDGLLVVAEEEVATFLGPLPISRLWGVGPRTEEALSALALRTIGELARLDERTLARAIGEARAVHLLRLARGLDDRDVVPDREAVSVGHEDTFDEDCFDRERLRAHLLDQADRAAARLRALGLRTRVVTLKIKYADHRRLSRRASLKEATDDGSTVGRVACALLARVPELERRGVRLTGVSLSGFVTEPGAVQLGLLDGEGAAQQVADRVGLGAVLDQIAARFGPDALRRAVHLPASGAPEAAEDCAADRRSGPGSGRAPGAGPARGARTSRR
ncbi:MAG: DNA polymerase IV [Deltaproteobacteria bacterium]|nr:DNA polymerase IV [Deltaproteobacteria bacterium]